ncbi:MAG: hypothetical protein K2P73_05310 [Lachnospiraceae bacterium]|nr:hypothetical protein [Lachnospiraceae bacterium]
MDVCKEIKSDIIILPGRSAGFAFQGIAVSLPFLIKFCKGGHIGIFLMLWDKSAVIVLGKIGEGAVLFHKVLQIFSFSLYSTVGLLLQVRDAYSPWFPALTL